MVEEEGFKNSVLDEALPVAVTFWSPMVEKAVEMSPMIETTLDRFAGQLKLVKMDTYRNQRVAKRYGVTKNPTIVFFHGGEVVATLVEDAITEESISKTVAEILPGS